MTVLNINGEEWVVERPIQNSSVLRYTSTKRRKLILLGCTPTKLWSTIIIPNRRVLTTRRSESYFNYLIKNWEDFYEDDRRFVSKEYKVAIDPRNERIYYMDLDPWAEARSAIYGALRQAGILNDKDTLASLLAPKRSYRDQLRESLAEKESLQKKLEAALKREEQAYIANKRLLEKRSNEESLETKAFKLLNDIAKNEKVESLSVLPSGYLRVCTRHLYIVSKKVSYSIGKFQIDIKLGKTFNPENTIRFSNLTRQVHGYHHPHIPNHGIPCWGEARSMLRSAYEKFNIATIVVIALTFLESVNIADHWGARITEWPKGKPRKKSTKKKSTKKKSVKKKPKWKTINMGRSSIAEYFVNLNTTLSASSDE